MSQQIEPDPSDCCGSGCDPCIFDVYEQFRNNKKTSEKSTNCISGTKYTTFVVKNVKKLTENAYVYTFSYKMEERSDDDVSLSFNPGQHFLVRSEDPNGSGSKYFTRAYTPISNSTDLSFDVLIKLYRGGKMSEYFRWLRPGDETLWRGPYGSYEIDYSLKNLLMICQGTGIAPMLAVIETLLKNEFCETAIKLLYSCNPPYFHNELYRLAAFWNFSYELFGNNFQPKYNEIVHNRRLASTDIETYLTDIDHDRFQVVVCGSDSFSETVTRFLYDCNVNKDFIYIFYDVFFLIYKITYVHVYFRSA